MLARVHISVLHLPVISPGVLCQGSTVEPGFGHLLVSTSTGFTQDSPLDIYISLTIFESIDMPVLMTNALAKLEESENQPPQTFLRVTRDLTSIT